MGKLLQEVQYICEKNHRRYAEKILWEVREACPKQSGRTARSFKVTKEGKLYVVSSSKLTALYANDGNGGSGRIIASKRAVDRRGRPPGKLKITNGVNRTLAYRNVVHGYDGAHFIQEVAKRHQ